MSTRILIVDDHPIIQRGLAQLLEARADFVVAGLASTAKEAIEMVKSESPDLVLIDLFLGEHMAIELISEINSISANIRILIMSAHDEKKFAARCLRNGASGYFQKDREISSILKAIDGVMRGEVVVSPEVQHQLLHNLKLNSGEPGEVLSDRELRVFHLIGQGKTTRQIAEQMELSIKTIESYRERIKQKLSIESGALLTHAAVAWVIRKSR